MDLLKEKKINHGNQEFEIKLWRTGNGFRVQSFINGKQANPYVYYVDFNTTNDYEKYYGEKAYERLIKVAIGDIKEGLIFGEKL